MRLDNLSWHWHSQTWECATITPSKLVFRVKSNASHVVYPDGSLGYYPDIKDTRKFVCPVHPLLMQCLIHEWLKEEEPT